MSLIQKLFTRPRADDADLAPAMLEEWRAMGFLLVPNLVEAPVTEAINERVAQLASSAQARCEVNATADVLHGELCGSLLPLRDLPDSAFAGPIKLNNLFSVCPEVRAGTFHPAVLAHLAALLDDPPVAINSLNFLYGSQQGPHIDSWYMPPPSGNSLIVASLFLEAMHEDNGPLFYYPGSHLIPPYLFSHGGRHAIEEEMPSCRSYYEKELADRGIEKVTVHAEPGDVVFWHCQLMHGGSRIIDRSATRRSLVTHYWGSRCVPAHRTGRFGRGERYLRRDYAALGGA